jgi:hypothetical protein
MSLDYEKRLESEIERELKALPELSAPRTLISRVTIAIEKRQNQAWYRQGWMRWPAPIQAVSLLILTALFGVVCFGSWKISQAESLGLAMERHFGWLSVLGSVWHVIVVLLKSAALAIQNLHVGVLVACAFALAMGYAMCVGLGTVYFRVATARR